MSDPFIGEIRMVGFPYAPVGWALCNGQSLPVAQYQALYVLLGNTYGGNTSNFNLPDLQGRVPLHAGNGTGLPAYALGSKGGAASVTLTENQMPSHTHAATFVPTGSGGTPAVNVTVYASDANGGTNTPNGNYIGGNLTVSGSHPPGMFVTNPGSSTLGPIAGVSATLSGVPTGAGTVTNALAGNGQAFSTEPPYLAVYFIIALEGMYPSRS